MKTVEVIVEHAGKNLSAYIEGVPVITVGNDMKEIEDNMKEAIELYLEDNPNPCEVLSEEFELKFKINAATFINYYSSIVKDIIRKSKFPWFPERSVQFSGKRTKRSVQKKRLHTTLIKPEQKVNEDLCSGFIVS